MHKSVIDLHLTSIKGCMLTFSDLKLRGPFDGGDIRDFVTSSMCLLYIPFG